MKRKKRKRKRRRKRRWRSRHLVHLLQLSPVHRHSLTIPLHSESHHSTGRCSTTSESHHSTGGSSLSSAFDLSLFTNMDMGEEVKVERESEEV